MFLDVLGLSSNISSQHGLRILGGEVLTHLESTLNIRGRQWFFYYMAGKRNKLCHSAIHMLQGLYSS